jgi:hypothetical protein
MLSSDRWKTKDKLTQYRGLVKLLGKNLLLSTYTKSHELYTKTKYTSPLSFSLKLKFG